MKRKYARIFVILFAICALCFVAFGVAACKNKDHKHTYGEWQITKPTETKVGSAVKTCSTCEKDEEGHTITVTLPVLGNEGYTKSADTATCEAGGEILYTLYINNEKISFSISSSAKGHSFNEDFWLGDGSTHWHGSTCGHNVKRDEAPCVDENGDSNCDVCGYSIHKHSYVWNGNDDEHWKEPNCGDTTEIKEKEPHIDADNDDMCDTCGKILTHTHKYSEDWTFDENTHWHAPMCTDTSEGVDEDLHTFKDGVCKCGVKEAEINAYRILKEKTDLQDSFAEWLAVLKSAGVVAVRITESGDVVYDYSDGTVEGVYIAERTVRAEAITSDGNAVEGVWFMVSAFKNGEYQVIDGSIALGIGQTDKQGVVEITFLPVAGYSNSGTVYRVRLAEKKDVASKLGVPEDEIGRTIPNRYVLNEKSAGKIYTIEVCEDPTAEGIIGQFTFDFSKGWNAYEQFILPYARYYKDPLNAKGIAEENTTFEFITSGDNLFDYFYFIPANNYSFESANGKTPPEQLAIIEKNFAIAASGHYKLYFEIIDGDATATLYFWNEKGVNLGSYHNTNPDGTPSSEYITSLSGGTAGSGHYSGGNFVNVVIEPANGLRYYQLGLKSSGICKVKITVERTGDYIENLADYMLTWNDGEQISLSGVKLTAYATTSFALINVPAGLYALTFDNGFSAKDVEALTVYTDSDSKKKITVWEGDVPSVAFMETGAQYKCIIRITEQTSILYVVNAARIVSCTAVLEKYTLPTLSVDETGFLPVSSAQSIQMQLNDSLSGEYKITIGVCGINNISSSLNVYVGNKKYTLTYASGGYINRYVYTGIINIEDGDKTISISSGTAYSYTASVLLNSTN